MAHDQLRMSYSACDSSWLAKEVVYFCRQRPVSVENGGFRRTVQIAEDLSGLEMAIVSALDYVSLYTNSGEVKRISRLRRFSPRFADFYYDRLRDKKTRHVFSKWAVGVRDNYFVLHAVSAYWRDMLAGNEQRLRLAVVDDPIYFAPLVEYLLKRCIPVVAICHNVETLSRPQMVEASQTELLKYELDLLQKCALVVTISREETVLLKNVGANAYFHPYYPVEEIRKRLATTRSCRSGKATKDYLLLGTVWNPPTLQGMLSVLNHWQPAGLDGDRLIVAGYGTMQLLGHFPERKGIVFRGEISDSDVDEILGSCKACIVYQEYGSGALTKICEYLLAGVPVVANSHAARSYHNIAGVLEFESLPAMAHVLTELPLPAEKVQLPNPADSAGLLKKVQGILVQKQEIKEI